MQKIKLNCFTTSSFVPGLPLPITFFLQLFKWCDNTAAVITSTSKGWRFNQARTRGKCSIKALICSCPYKSLIAPTWCCLIKFFICLCRYPREIKKPQRANLKKCFLFLLAHFRQSKKRHQFLSPTSIKRKICRADFFLCRIDALTKVTITIASLRFSLIVGLVSLPFLKSPSSEQIHPTQPMRCLPPNPNL
jgi:hypothetical protein